MGRTFYISSFYRFETVPEAVLEGAQKNIYARGKDLAIKGLVLLATEGVNATVSGEQDAVRAFVLSVAQELGHAPYVVKESTSERDPFRRFSVQVREEIVTTNGHLYEPKPEDQATHLSPHEWNEKLHSLPDYTLLDVRNEYESRIGTFRGAIAPKLKNFQELPEFLETSGISPSKPLLMFCTGGIRCEKALPELQARGFSQVYQLDGGILNYFEKCSPDESEFEGECFVFDHRVAVDQRLRPSQRYGLCPHCGDPAAQVVACGVCTVEAKICDACAARSEKRACSKNCAYHLRLKLSNPRIPATGADRGA